MVIKMILKEWDLEPQNYSLLVLTVEYANWALRHGKVQ